MNSARFNSIDTGFPCAFISHCESELFKQTTTEPFKTTEKKEDVKN